MSKQDRIERTLERKKITEKTKGQIDGVDATVYPFTGGHKQQEMETTFGLLAVGQKFQFVVKGQRSPLHQKIENSYRNEADPNLGICNCLCTRDSVVEWLPKALPVILIL